MTADVKLTALTTVDDAIMHMQRGNAVVAFTSIKSGASYSYNIKESNNGRAFYVTLLTAGSPAYLGSIIEGQFKHTDKSRLSTQAPAFRAFAYVWAALAEYRMLAARLPKQNESVSIIEDVYVMPAWMQCVLPCPDYSDKRAGGRRQKT